MSDKCKISLIAPVCLALLTLRADPGALCIVDDFEDGELFDGNPLVWEWAAGFQLDHTVEDGDLVMFDGPNADDVGILYLPEFEGWHNLRMECSMVGPGDIGLINGSRQAQYWASVFENGDVGITKCTGVPPGPVDCHRLRNGPGFAIPESTHHIEFLRSGGEIEMRYWEVGVEPPVLHSLSVFADTIEGGSPGIWYAPLSPGSRGIIHWFEICFSQPVFLRGDCNDDGTVDISDAVCILNWLFLGGATPSCIAVTNTNGDAGEDISDAVYVLTHLFLGGPAPVMPYPECGPGTLPTDEETCETTPVQCPQ